VPSRLVQVKVLAAKFQELATKVEHADSVQDIIIHATVSLCGFLTRRAEHAELVSWNKSRDKRLKMPYGFPTLVDLAKDLVKESLQDPFPPTLHVLPSDLARSVLARIATQLETMLLLLHDTAAACTDPDFLNIHKKIRVRDAQSFAHYDVMVNRSNIVL